MSKVIVLLVVVDGLAGLGIYYGGSIDDNVHSVEPYVSSLSTDVLDKKTIEVYSTVYIAMTAVSTDGVESILSEVVTFNP